MTEEREEYQVLEAMPQIPEAPASANVFFAVEGFNWQLTIRGFETDGTAGSNLLKKVKAVNAHLKKMGAEPTYKNSYTSSPKPKAEAKAEEEEPGEAKDWCPIHETKMKKWEKEGRSWYSHKIERPDGTEYWCNGKEK